MGERAEELAAKFEQVNQELLDEIEECSEEKWPSPCSGRWRSTTSLPRSPSWCGSG